MESIGQSAIGTRGIKCVLAGREELEMDRGEIRCSTQSDTFRADDGAFPGIISSKEACQGETRGMRCYGGERAPPEYEPLLLYQR